MEDVYGISILNIGAETFPLVQLGWGLFFQIAFVLVFLAVGAYFFKKYIKK